MFANASPAASSPAPSGAGWPAWFSQFRREILNAAVPHRAGSKDPPPAGVFRNHFHSAVMVLSTTKLATLIASLARVQDGREGSQDGRGGGGNPPTKQEPPRREGGGRGGESLPFFVFY